MKKMLFATAAALTVTIAAPARAADLPLKTETPFAARFSWTGCYLGGHLGGGFAHKDVTDPVQLVQDSLAAAAVTNDITTVGLSPSGVRDRRADWLRLPVVPLGGRHRGCRLRIEP